MGEHFFQPIKTSNFVGMEFGAITRKMDSKKDVYFEMGVEDKKKFVIKSADKNTVMSFEKNTIRIGNALSQVIVGDIQTSLPHVLNNIQAGIGKKLVFDSDTSIDIGDAGSLTGDSINPTKLEKLMG